MLKVKVGEEIREILNQFGNERALLKATSSWGGMVESEIPAVNEDLFRQWELYVCSVGAFETTDEPHVGLKPDEYEEYDFSVGMLRRYRLVGCQKTPQHIIEKYCVAEITTEF